MRKMENVSKYLKEEDYYIKLKILKKQLDVLNIQVR